MRPLIWWLGLAIMVLVGAGLSFEAYTVGLPDGLGPYDKAFHFIIGGLVAFFLDGALRRRMLRVGPLPIPAAAVLVLVPAAIEEYVQRYTALRTSSLGDFVADFLGVVVFIWLSRRIDQKPA